VLAEAGVAPAWTVLLNSDEETGSLHSQRVIRAEARACAARGGLGLAMEPSLPDGSLVLERLGSATFRIACEGRAAHAGRDFAQGVSAVNALAGKILDAAKLVDLDAGTVVNMPSRLATRIADQIRLALQPNVIINRHALLHLHSRPHPPLGLLHHMPRLVRQVLLLPRR
jgi:acetylornithine deacetylase/succinyl-diaminopimelate desuccinylase-like protein